MVFGISFSELILIFVIGLVIFGPEQMPSIARKIGGFIGRIRKLRADLSTHLYQQAGIEELQQLKEELSSAVIQMRHSLTESVDPQDLLDNHDYHIQEMHFLYQPELDFERQPELFDE
ncbi:MAG: twin-arginine translocase subunit TatB [Proteobacteria bacterium]|nr:MAG: twin-arginine translocase subunit TatB [Pseudomonadota bacterium]